MGEILIFLIGTGKKENKIKSILRRAFRRLNKELPLAENNPKYNSNQE